MRIKNLLKKVFSSNYVWSSAIHESNDLKLNIANLKLNKVFTGKLLRLDNLLPHTLADPFLIAKENVLYIFLESQSRRQQGKIISYMTKDLKNYTNLGIILEEDYHLSYPFVFSHDNAEYLIPESESASEITLYKFEAFPYRPKKIRVLLHGRYCDTSLFYYEGLWYLFTTSDKGLEIFWSENLLNSEFQPHFKNPITNDSKFCRSGGSIFIMDDKIFRPCQDCSNTYGENINIMEITELSTKQYNETQRYNNLFNSDFSGWNKNGGHHLSIVNFMNKYIIATDKKHRDLFINKFISLIRRP
jgi:hypothetical protein